MQHAQLTPGWYVDARGKKMYWTGQEWVASAPIRLTEKAQTPERRETTVAPTVAPIGAIPSALPWDVGHGGNQADSFKNERTLWGPVSVILLVVAIVSALAVGWVASDKIGSLLGSPVELALNVPIGPFS